MSRSKRKVPVVRVPGPLAPYAAEFTDELTARGLRAGDPNRPSSGDGDLSKWLQSRELGVADLTAERIEEYLAERRSRGDRGFARPGA